MSLTGFDGILAGIEVLNHGVDHGCDYALHSFSNAGNIGEALDIYFSAMSTSRIPPQPAERWHIRTTELGPSWKIFVAERLKYWFFQEEFSPRVDAWNQDAFVEQALDYLLMEIGEPEVYEVFVKPPM